MAGSITKLGVDSFLDANLVFDRDSRSQQNRSCVQRRRASFRVTHIYRFVRCGCPRIPYHKNYLTDLRGKTPPAGLSLCEAPLGAN
jgi:hypothetical protein